MEVHTPLEHFSRSLMNLSATFIKEPHDPQFTNEYFVDAQAESRAIQADELTPEQCQDLSATLHYIWLLTSHDARYTVIHVWLAGQLMRFALLKP